MTGPSADLLRSACQTLADKDPALAKAYQQVDLPNWRTANANYQTLARGVVYQLISTKAADAIWQRIVQRHPDVTPGAILNDDQDSLQACGLSGPKLSHLNSIAHAVETGALDFNRLAEAPMADARTELISVKGIGPWTAETFLMNALGRLDAFPHGDVGLMEAYKRLSNSADRLEKKAFSALAEHWRPYRAVAAHLLYDWFNANRK